ncbi:MAG: GNAT family N-acetyltransferase [Candidatus Cloacimonetes bacterium]|nr:GNAT family N-acetyltransferase [Candidatus Cloacimonadota bacterium]
MLIKIFNLLNFIPEFTHKTTTQEISERIKGKDHDFIIVHEKSEPAGFLVAYNIDQKTYYNWIMGVLPKFRRKGYGRKLIELFESIAKEKGYTVVQVKTTDKFKAMQRLLAEKNYKEIGKDEEGKIILRKNL